MDILYRVETGRASVKQEQRLIREEIGQAYRLGVYQKEYAFQIAKALAIGCSMASVFLFMTAIVSIYDQKIIIIDILYLLMFAIAIRQLLRYQKMSVYVYTRGLYLFRRKGSQSNPQGQSIRWDQIERAYKSRIGIHLQLKNEFGNLLLPSAFFKIDELYTTIDRKITLYNIPNE
jgi:hypothetical protein